MARYQAFAENGWFELPAYGYGGIHNGAVTASRSIWNLAINLRRKWTTSPNVS